MGWNFGLNLINSFHLVLLDILELNFDDSYIREENQGGIGGVIREHDGAIISNYSGPIGASDANEAEIYSLLISYNELKWSSGFKSIVEGDSQLAAL